MNKKTVIKVLVGLGLLIIVLMAIGEYQWRTQGLGVVIDRKTALGVVTNQYGIRDQDLKLIESSNFDEPNKKLLIKVAKDYQEQIIHSNDLDWIKANGRAIVSRQYCILGYEIDVLKRKAGYPSIVKKFYDNDERRYLSYEFDANYNNLNLSTSTETEEELKKCYE